MSNDYFDPTANTISANSLAKSSHINDLRNELGVGWDKLPTPDNINKGSSTFAVDTGSANSYVIALPQTATSYTDGMTVLFKPINDNTASATINVDGLGVKSIKRHDGGDLVAGDIVTTGIYQMTYDGTNFVMTGVTAASLLQSYVTAAQTAQGLAETAQADAETAQGLAETAQGLAETAQGLAETAQGLAETAQSNTETIYDNFDDRFLGDKASDPTLDNDGAALITGALYFNTTLDQMKVYTGSAWINAFSSVQFTGTATAGVAEVHSAITSSANALSADASTANSFKHVLTENTTLSFASVPTGSYTVAVMVVQDASASGYTFTWPSSVKWPYGIAPDLSNTADAIDSFVLHTFDSGTTWYGFISGQDMGVPA